MKKKERGFSLIEVLVGIALIAIAMLGLAQLFTISIMNNLRSSDLSNATFLAQQTVDYLRTLTSAELDAFPSAAGEANDETIDINRDGTVDYRRIIDIRPQGHYRDVDVLVFSTALTGVDGALLLAHPDTYKIKARIRTVIGR